MTSNFNQIFLFLTKLAWNSRVTLPILVTAAFMAMDFRMQVEINVQTERVLVREDVGDGGYAEYSDDTDHESSWETISEDNEEDDDDDFDQDEMNNISLD